MAQIIEMERIEGLDLYKFLDIDPGADEKTIRSAYRKKTLTCHPDKNKDDKNAAVRFHQLTDALDVLVDPSKRRAYDVEVKARQDAEQRKQRLEADQRRQSRAFELFIAETKRKLLEAQELRRQELEAKVQKLLEAKEQRRKELEKEELAKRAKEQRKREIERELKQRAKDQRKRRRKEEKQKKIDEEHEEKERNTKFWEDFERRKREFELKVEEERRQLETEKEQKQEQENEQSRRDKIFWDKYYESQNPSDSDYEAPDPETYYISSDEEIHYISSSDES